MNRVRDSPMMLQCCHNHRRLAGKRVRRTFGTVKSPQSTPKVKAAGGTGWSLRLMVGKASFVDIPGRKPFTAIEGRDEQSMNHRLSSWGPGEADAGYSAGTFWSYYCVVVISFESQ